jgi:acyl-CoA reductase-like NAD-dependent aldehyde dehydrogenase
MNTPLSRRELAAALAAAVPALAAGQATPPQPADDPTRAAADRLRSSSEQLAKAALPMDTEPAFQFRA